MTTEEQLLHFKNLAGPTGTIIATWYDYIELLN